MSSQTKALLCEYRHDPVDRLSAQTTPGQTATQRFYQGDHLATEVHGQQRRAIVRVDDQPLAQQHHTSSSIDTALFVTDRQGSVLQMLTGAASHHMAYTAYGRQSPESGLLSLLEFNGERRDPVTGHYLLGNGYRAFNTVLMRFHSPDRLSPFSAGGVNAYAYCLGDPINRIDPTGNISFPMLVKTLVKFRSMRSATSQRSLPLPDTRTNGRFDITGESAMGNQRPRAPVRPTQRTADAYGPDNPLSRTASMESLTYSSGSSDSTPAGSRSPSPDPLANAPYHVAQSIRSRGSLYHSRRNENIPD